MKTNNIEKHKKFLAYCIENNAKLGFTKQLTAKIVRAYNKNVDNQKNK